MTIFVGEAITVVCAAVDPLTGLVISDATGVVEFFAPPKNPAKVPTDRSVDEGPYSVAFLSTVTNKDGTVGAYVAYVSTVGWVGGKWAYRVTLSGSYDTWEYGAFTLVA